MLEESCTSHLKLGVSQEPFSLLTSVKNNGSAGVGLVSVSIINSIFDFVLVVSIFVLVVSKGCKPGASSPFQRITENSRALFSTSPLSGGLDLNSSNRGCARLGSGVSALFSSLALSTKPTPAP